MQRSALIVTAVLTLLACPAGPRAAERPTGPVTGTLRASLARTHPSEARPIDSLVSVAATGGSGGVSACGVIVGEERDTIVVVTAAHALPAAHAAFVTAAGERLRVRASRIVAGHDLAFVTADRPWHTFAVARYARAPEIGARVRLWGPVAGEPFTAHDAVVRPMDSRVTDAPPGAFALDCAACGHGDSGTGVFNDRNELVGIVTAGYYADAERILVLSDRFAE